MLQLWLTQVSTSRAVSRKPGVLACVPHFEKMLYDNAQLARVYLHAWQVTGNEFFRIITEEILDYAVREMTDPSGGLCSTQDADPTPLRSGDGRSEGEEGKFFVWTPGEIRALLFNEADAFMAAYGLTRHGNASTGSAQGFEGKNILEFLGDMDKRPALGRRGRERAPRGTVRPGLTLSPRVRIPLVRRRGRQADHAVSIHATGRSSRHPAGARSGARPGGCRRGTPQRTVYVAQSASQIT